MVGLHINPVLFIAVVLCQNFMGQPGSCLASGFCARSQEGCMAPLCSSACSTELVQARAQEKDLFTRYCSVQFYKAMYQIVHPESEECGLFLEESCIMCLLQAIQSVHICILIFKYLSRHSLDNRDFAAEWVSLLHWQLGSSSYNPGDHRI